MPLLSWGVVYFTCRLAMSSKCQLEYNVTLPPILPGRVSANENNHIGAWPFAIGPKLRRREAQCFCRAGIQYPGL